MQRKANAIWELFKQVASDDVESNFVRTQSDYICLLIECILVGSYRLQIVDK